jgi:hypothetical protein
MPICNEGIFFQRHRDSIYPKSYYGLPRSWSECAPTLMELHLSGIVKKPYQKILALFSGEKAFGCTWNIGANQSW